MYCGNVANGRYCIADEILGNEYSDFLMKVIGILSLVVGPSSLSSESSYGLHDQHFDIQF